MEIISKILNGIVKYSFWLVCGLVGILAITTTVLTTRSMNSTRVKIEKEIDSDLAKILKVQNTSAEAGSESVKAHPNAFTSEGMKSQIKIASDEALEAWEKRYKIQSPAYVWPKDLLGATTTAFESTPIPEKLSSTGKQLNLNDASISEPVDDTASEEITAIDTQSLQKFAEVIRKRLPQIAEIIGAKWNFEVSASSETAEDTTGDEVGAGLQRGAKRDSKTSDGGVTIQKEVVAWRNQDQERWNLLVTEFQQISRLPSNRPTLPMALYIQQDLWLLESLFKVIKEVNRDADALGNADIKKIDHIFFGKEAQGLSGNIVTPNARLAREAADHEKKKQIPAIPKTPANQALQNKTKFIFKANSRDFLDGRYVDGRFEPLAAKDVRLVINTDKLSGNAEIVVAKRIPFRVAFEMDERKIPNFLAACANSPFRFEVRQIRINRHVPGEQPSLDGNTFQSVGGNEAGETTTGGRGSVNEYEVLVANRTNYIVKVEFYGFVKVYNPVNRKLFEQPKEPTGNQTASK